MKLYIYEWAEVGVYNEGVHKAGWSICLYLYKWNVLNFVCIVIMIYKSENCK